MPIISSSSARGLLGGDLKFWIDLPYYCMIKITSWQPNIHCNVVLNHLDSRRLYSTNQLYFFYLHVHKRLQLHFKDKTNCILKVSVKTFFLSFWTCDPKKLIPVRGPPCWMGVWVCVCVCVCVCVRERESDILWLLQKWTLLTHWHLRIFVFLSGFLHSHAP